MKVRGLLKNALLKQCQNGAVEPQTSVTCDQRTGNGVIKTATGSNTLRDNARTENFC